MIRNVIKWSAGVFFFACPLAFHSFAAQPREKVIERMKAAADYQISVIIPEEELRKEKRPGRTWLGDNIGGWQSGTFHLGLFKLWELTRDPKYMEQMMYVGNLRGFRPYPRMTGEDDLIIGQMYLRLYEIYKDPKMLEPMKEAARLTAEKAAEQEKTRNPAILKHGGEGGGDVLSFADALFMAPPNWALLIKITGDADGQYAAFLEELYQRNWGFLFDTTYKLYYRDTHYIGKTRNGRPIFWGRGNGWVMGSLSLILEKLPEEHPLWPVFSDRLRLLSEGIAACELPGGGFGASLMNHEEFPEVELSATSLISYGMTFGLNRGILPKEKYEPIVKRAWELVSAMQAPDGAMRQCQQGGVAPARFDPNNNEDFGTGAYLLFASEYLNMAGAPVVSECIEHQESFKDGLNLADDSRRPAGELMALLREAQRFEQDSDQVERAIDLYLQVLAEAEHNEQAAAIATFQLGVCYQNKGDDAQATKYFKATVSNFPGQAPWVDRAREHLEKSYYIGPDKVVLVEKKVWPPFNWASFDQDKIVSYKGYQYAVYWGADRKLCVARRHCQTDEIQIVRFNDYILADHRPASEQSNGHRNTVIGISPCDGRLHLSWDHHVDDLNYMRSQKGLITNPPKILSEVHFEPRQPLSPKYPQCVTYPRFFNNPSGQLYFFYRSGGSGMGDNVCFEYDHHHGSWQMISERLFSQEGVYPGWQNSESRNAYMHDILFDAAGRLHISWVYREIAQTWASNHDLHYAYSEDQSRTWKNNHGAVIADTRAGQSIALDSPGIKVFDIPVFSWLMNACGMTLDSENRPHVATFHTEKPYVPEKLEHDPPAHVHDRLAYYHYWRDHSGKWHRSKPLPKFGGHRPMIVVAPDDTIIIYFSTVQGFMAHAARGCDDWQTWTTLHLTGPEFQVQDATKPDLRLLSEHGILSFTANPFAKTKESGFAILEFDVQRIIDALY